MRAKLRSMFVVLWVVGAVFATGTADAGTRASTTVTIETKNGDFWGTVESPRPLKCAQDRKIILYKQVGSEQDPSVDKKIASDTAGLSGDVYEWSTGNTGVYGKFYARAKRTLNCKADTSPTVRSVRS